MVVILSLDSAAVVLVTAIIFCFVCNNWALTVSNDVRRLTYYQLQTLHSSEELLTQVNNE